MDYVTVAGVNIFPFESDAALIDYIDKHKGVLVAIGAQRLSRQPNKLVK